MPKKPHIILLPIVLLLFVGSSGCTSSDISTVMEIFGGTNGPQAGDVAAQTLGGDKTGDKDKDSLLDAGGKILDEAKKSAELDDVVKKSINGEDIPGGIKRIDDALTTRPDDWGLYNRKVALLAYGNANLEQLGAVKQKALDICASYSGKAKDRCQVAQAEDYENQLYSLKSRQGATNCSVLLALELLYVNPPYSASLTMRDKYRERLDAQYAEIKTEGCYNANGDLVH